MGQRIIDRSAAIPVDRLPAPRLQLRWAEFTTEELAKYGRQFGTDDVLCHYELVLPLTEHDIRREIYKDGEQVGERNTLVAPLKEPTIRGGSKPPCDAGDGQLFHDRPYRDGAHANWDAKVLGNPPIFVITMDGLGIPDDPADTEVAA